jgi:hypothetical protein
MISGVAEWDYTAQEEDETTLIKGDHVVDVVRIDEG